MKEVKTFVVLVYNTGTSSNSPIYRLNVGAKTDKEAEEFVFDWLKKNNLTARTRNPKTLYMDKTKDLRYKQIERIMPSGEHILVVP